VVINAGAFPTAELNSSFYRWPRPVAFRNWQDRLPDEFRLSVKAPRGLTHARKLYAPETWLQRIQPGWHELGGKRAALLVQLPPTQPRDDVRLAYFLAQVPGWMRVAVEFRHPSWHCEEIITLLAAHRAAYCVMSGANLPCVLRATTDFVYLRMHGPDHHHLYAGSYPDADLAWWADRIREWSLTGQDVFVYFNNDGDANAVRNARALRALLASDGVSYPGTALQLVREREPAGDRDQVSSYLQLGAHQLRERFGRRGGRDAVLFGERVEERAPDVLQARFPAA
jgi:uncharacterized protein YecE (DUF72 family)